MRRVLEWLEHDRPAYWKQQLRRAQDDVHQAHMDLQRCLMFPVGDERPSCREERDALKKAQSRLAYCEQKVERLREWIRELRHEITEYEGRMRKLDSFTEVDVPQAVARLTKLLQRLEEYQALRTPTGGPAPRAEQLVAELFSSSGSGEGSDASL